jgi:sugar phosphate permease
VIGAGTVISGVCASFLVGYMLGKTKKNRLLLRICCFGSSIMLIVGIFVLQSGIDWLVYVNIFTIGALIVPIGPIGLNFASELTFPQAPTVVTGFVLMTGCIGGFILGILNSILAVINPIYAITLMAVLTSIASLLSIFIQEDLKRYKFSQKLQGGLMSNSWTN